MQPPPDLKDIVAAIVSDRTDRTAARRLVSLCHGLALAFLRYHQQSARLDSRFFGMNLEDLALDCIADLFRRDEEGRFFELRRYFARVEATSLSADALFEAIRRLVVGVVYESIFRNYQQEDPSLARLIRNLKRTIQHHPALMLVKKRGEWWLVPSDDHLLSADLPCMPPDFLEAFLMTTVPENTTLNRIIERTGVFLRGQVYYRNGFPLTGFARVLRHVVVQLNGESHDDTASDLSPNEIQGLIRRSVRSVHRTLYPAYVGKEKIEPDLFETYFRAIQYRLEADLVDEDGQVLTNYNVLRTFLNDLTREAYGQDHRSVFEYLSRCVRIQLRKEWLDDG